MHFHSLMTVQTQLPLAYLGTPSMSFDVGENMRLRSSEDSAARPKRDQMILAAWKMPCLLSKFSIPSQWLPMAKCLDRFESIASDLTTQSPLPTLDNVCTLRAWLACESHGTLWTDYESISNARLSIHTVQYAPTRTRLICGDGPLISGTIGGGGGSKKPCLFLGRTWSIERDSVSLLVRCVWFYL